MNQIKTLSVAIALVAGTLASAGHAHGYKAGNLSIQHPWARETAVGQEAGGGFLVITNSGAREDRLVAGESSVAAEVQLHTMTMDGGIMRMRQVKDGIAIPAKGMLELKPGSFHIMFIGLKRPLKAGERVPVTLRFQRAGKVRVAFAVEKVGAMGQMPMRGMEHDHAGH
jgi:copper(I)-binding protein